MRADATWLASLLAILALVDTLLFLASGYFNGAPPRVGPGPRSASALMRSTRDSAYADRPLGGPMKGA